MYILSLDQVIVNVLFIPFRNNKYDALCKVNYDTIQTISHVSKITTNHTYIFLEFLVHAGISSVLWHWLSRRW